MPEKVSQAKLTGAERYKLRQAAAADQAAVAQVVRKKRRRIERRRGKCSMCHDQPRRTGGKNCLKCHRERESILGRQRRIAARLERQRVAKEARKHERAVKAAKRKLAAEGENRAYLDFLVN